MAPRIDPRLHKADLLHPPPHLLQRRPPGGDAEGGGVSEILVPDLLFLVGFFVIAFAAATLMLKREVG